MRRSLGVLGLLLALGVAAALYTLRGVPAEIADPEGQTGAEALPEPVGR